MLAEGFINKSCTRYSICAVRRSDKAVAFTCSMLYFAKGVVVVLWASYSINAYMCMTLCTGKIMVVMSQYLWKVIIKVHFLVFFSLISIHDWKKSVHYFCLWWRSCGGHWLENMTGWGLVVVGIIFVWQCKATFLNSQCHLITVTTPIFLYHVRGWYCQDYISVPCQRLVLPSLFFCTMSEAGIAKPIFLPHVRGGIALAVALHGVRLTCRLPETKCSGCCLHETVLLHLQNDCEQLVNTLVSLGFQIPRL